MWWMWVLGIGVVIASVYLIERNRGTRGDAAREDRHLNHPDARGGGGFGS